MDLYHIPGDTGKFWRMNKLIDYKHYMPFVDTEFLVAYAKRHNLSDDDKIVLAWYHSLTYSEISAVYLLKYLNWRTITKSQVQNFWKEYKNNLCFASSRRYVKNMDWFVPLMDSFMRAIKRNPYRWFSNLIKSTKDPVQRYRIIWEELEKWPFMGRFSIGLFLICLIDMHSQGQFPFELAETYELDWNKGANETSGMLNILYLDEEANEFDRSGYLSKDLIPILNNGLLIMQDIFQQKYPEDHASFADITPKICPFRNLFKQSRYGGYHHDRQLEHLYFMQEGLLSDSELTTQLFTIRSEIYPDIFLGEVNGWKGIRKERKRLFIEKGLIGFEELQKSPC